MFNTLLLSSLVLFGSAGNSVQADSNFGKNSLSSEDVDNRWAQWVFDFRKAYDTPLERAQRRAIFIENLFEVERHNAEANVLMHNFTIGLNHFSDLTHTEFAEKYLRPFSSSADSHTMELPETDVKSINWVEKGGVTPVKDQGQCGSCWSFSATGGMEGANFVANDELVSLSEQQLVDCADKVNHGCNGGLMDYAFRYVINNKGITTEDNYPYTAKDGTCNPAEEASPVVTISNYYDVPTNEESQLMAAVALQPVSVAIDAEGASFQMYKSGVYNAECGTTLDHGVLVVGYGTENGLDYWLVKNSWGPTWGDGGYIKMARNTKNPEGQCGIAMQPSRPVV